MDGNVSPAGESFEMTGILKCKACRRPIRDHGVTEFHTGR